MQRVNCERYPCHFPEQDCTLCFCPFYPCMDERTNGCQGKDGWSCYGCKIVHRREVADMVMDSLMNGECLPEVWKKVMRLL